MKSIYSSALFLSGNLLTLSSLAKETITIEQDPQLRQASQHMVALPDSKICLLDDEFNQICYHYGLSLRVGWEFEQEWDDDTTTVEVMTRPADYEGSNELVWYDFDGEYKIGVEVYAETSAGMALLLNIDQFFYNLVEFDTETFEMIFGAEIKYYYGSRRTCLGAYAGLDDFAIQFLMTMKWMECYKNVIEELWCWDNWFGKYAKWMDSCEFGIPQPITMWSHDVDLSVDNPYYIVTTTDDTDCWPGLLWTDGAASSPLALPN